MFISNISASYYSVQQLWSTPYEVTHNEPFPDASIVVPFGCAVLVLRDSDDRSKFSNRCTLMIFVHYSDDHPLFTYAVYSPRTKRVIHRQDVIFLTSVFPMRLARTASGLAQGGDSLKVVRSPPSMLEGCPDEFSFGSWSHGDAPTMMTMSPGSTMWRHQRTLWRYQRTYKDCRLIVPVTIPFQRLQFWFPFMLFL